MKPFTAALRTALERRPRRIAPVWFYDAAGSRLFERIGELPEYYPTRTELALLDRLAAELAQRAGPEVELVEFGAGNPRKASILLDAFDRPRRYLPVDVSGEHLHAVLGRLQAAHPALEIEPVVADYTQTLRLPARSGRRIGFYPGSSIGNFEPAEAVALLRRFAALLEGGPLLVGVDRVKDPAVLHAAYNDAAGVTAAFNLNLWARANREADADFDLARWWHSAFYQPALQRIEMHLVSRCAQRVSVAGQRYDFAEGESVHTENSYKYTLAGFSAVAREAGYVPAAAWSDAAEQFSLIWLEARAD